MSSKFVSNGLITAGVNIIIYPAHHLRSQIHTRDLVHHLRSQMHTRDLVHQQGSEIVRINSASPSTVFVSVV